MKSKCVLVMVVLVGFASLTISAQGNEKAQWINLFNGKDLKGWKQLNGKANYEVKNGEIIGYETGFNAFSKTLGILENKKIQIGRNSYKSSIKRGGYSIEFVLQRNEITEENIELLQILDCLKMIKGISSREKDDSLGILWRILRKFNKTKIEKLVKYSAKYPSSTRALLGFLLEDNKKIMELVEKIRETLNPISKYQLGIRKLDDFLKEKWNLK